MRPLNLFVPGEGKNRVDFLRECNVPGIPAFVSPTEYPAAARLAVYDVKFGGRDEQWIVLDARWVQRAPPLFHRALRVLHAYGVVPSVPWPRGYPAPRDVCNQPRPKGRSFCRGERRGTRSPTFAFLLRRGPSGG